MEALTGCSIASQRRCVTDSKSSSKTARSLAQDDHGRDLVLLYHLGLVASHLVQLPAHSILPPLGAAEDSVAVGLKSALHAEGDGDANIELRQMFRFLGGTFVESAEHSYEVISGTPPDSMSAAGSGFAARFDRVANGRRSSGRSSLTRHSRASGPSVRRQSSLYAGNPLGFLPGAQSSTIGPSFRASGRPLPRWKPLQSREARFHLGPQVRAKTTSYNPPTRERQ